MTNTTLEKSTHKVVSPAEWLRSKRTSAKRKGVHPSARRAEPAKTRIAMGTDREELCLRRTERHREPVDLFEGRSQLLIYHFMFGPGWKEGCPSCSFLADSFDAVRLHLAQRSTTLAVVSRATLPEIEAFKKRMGWHFKWVSSFSSDFNADFHVSFTKDEMSSGKAYYNYQNAGFPF